MILKNKNILITGASKGLGRSLCITLAREGANIAFNYSFDDESANETKKEISKFDVKSICFKASVSDNDAIKDLVLKIKNEWKTIDILINNAGISQMLPFAMLEEKDWDIVIDTNLKGTYLVTRAVIQLMIKQRQGKILNIGSLAGMRLIESPVHYASSKAAIKGFTESLAKEMGRFGITVNCIAPGLLEGGLSDNLPSYKLDDYLKYCSLGRVGKFTEISEFAAFLVSDDNSYMNGTTIIMDGGVL